MSCIAPFEEWSNIFRNRSFNLCKNDCDFGEKFDSVVVSESITLPSMTNLSVSWVNCCPPTGLTVLASNISPDFHSWEDHLSSMFHSELSDELAPITGLPELGCCSFHELRGTLWLSCLVFPRLCDAVESSTFGSLALHRETKFIIGFDFAVTLSSTCIFLRSLRHHFRTIGRTEMANVEQTEKMIPFITCKISLCQYVCELVLGVNVFDLDLWGPNWFYQTTNQEQLCGFWKHVSLSGFFPLWSSWSLLRCLQTHTTKLPDDKNWRLREQNQHCPNHWSLLEIVFVFELCEVLNEPLFGSDTSLPVLYYSDSCFQ